jgi:hypothetical protein
MKLNSTLFQRPPMARGFITSRLLFGLLIVAVALHAMACQAEVQDNRGTTSSSSGLAGAGGMAGSGGGEGLAASGGMGGGVIVPDDGGPGDAAYSAYNLFTGVPRFIILKTDPVRNLCFRIWVEGFGGGPGLSIDVTDPWAANHAEVTNSVDDCTNFAGFPPPPMSLAPAVSGSGTIFVQGSYPSCAVSVHVSLSFDASEPWIPTTEAFDVDALSVDGGCS